MKLRCERDVLVEALTTVSRAVASRGGMPQALSGLLVELAGDELHLVGGDGDLDLIIEERVPVAGLEDGLCVVPARLTTDIVRALEPGAVTVESDDDEAQLVSGRSQFAVRTFPAEDFPRLPPVEAEATTLAGNELGEAIRQVARAASGDDLRPSFTGVLMSPEEGHLRLVATDSYRLALRDIPGSAGLAEGARVIVPAKALTELQRLLSGTGEVSERQARFSAGDVFARFEVGTTRLTTRLIKGDFPEYRHLIPPSYPNRLIIAKDAFLDALRRMRLLVKDTTTSVRVAMGPEGVQLSAASQELGHATEDIEAKYDGAELTVAFNPSYLMDGVEAVPEDEVLVETIDEAKPAMVRSVEDHSYRYLLMPVRIP